jgi:autoinducer 2-degrading protein
VKYVANVSFLARMTVKEGREEEFIRLAREMERQVQANEPDTLYYRFFRLRGPREFAVMESFADEAAEELHMNSSYLQEMAPSLIDCMEGDPPYVREFLDPID